MLEFNKTYKEWVCDKTHGFSKDDETRLLTKLKDTRKAHVELHKEDQELINQQIEKSKIIKEILKSRHI